MLKMLIIAPNAITGDIQSCCNERNILHIDRLHYLRSFFPHLQNVLRMNNFNAGKHCIQDGLNLFRRQASLLFDCIQMFPYLIDSVFGEVEGMPRTQENSSYNGIPNQSFQNYVGI